MTKKSRAKLSAVIVALVCVVVTIILAVLAAGQSGAGHIYPTVTAIAAISFISINLQFILEGIDA